MSYQGCGCDEDAGWVCERHREDAMKDTVEARKYPLGGCHTGDLMERPPIRTFTTGATRDTNTGKHEYDGFNSPLVEQRFAEYMTQHRVQADGSVRPSDNWKKGIPVPEYFHSIHRHFIDLWLHMEGYPTVATEADILNVLSALRFNINGMMHELLKEHIPCS